MGLGHPEARTVQAAQQGLDWALGGVPQGSQRRLDWFNPNQKRGL